MMTTNSDRQRTPPALRGPAAVLSLVLLTVSAAPSGAAADPWERLAAARSSLAGAGPVAAPFDQSFLPAGFSAGEEESGVVAMALPDCLRWDYAEPFPKVFLLCGDTVWSWSPEDAAGRKEHIDAAEAAGLDLLLVAIDRLRERYEATWVDDGAGRARLELLPRTGDTGFREAALEIDAATGHPALLTWIDREGSRTSFRLGPFEPLEDSGRFAPPPGISWQE